MAEMFDRLHDHYVRQRKEGSKPQSMPLHVAYGVASYEFTLPDGSVARVGLEVEGGRVAWIEVNVPHFNWVRVYPGATLFPSIQTVVEDYADANGI